MTTIIIHEILDTDGNFDLAAMTDAEAIAEAVRLVSEAGHRVMSEGHAVHANGSITVAVYPGE